MQAFKPSDEVDFSRRYTLEEFWALPKREDHARYELIGGYLYMVPPPNPLTGTSRRNWHECYLDL